MEQPKHWSCGTEKKQTDLQDYGTVTSQLEICWWLILFQPWAKHLPVFYLEEAGNLPAKHLHCKMSAQQKTLGERIDADVT